jgi:hypothetical protein
MRTRPGARSDRTTPGGKCPGRGGKCPAPSTSQFFGERARKEDLARQIVEQYGIDEGLVRVFAVLEPWRTFLPPSAGERAVRSSHSAKRKCVFLYDYFMDRELGLIHVRLQTSSPLQLQGYVNGHEFEGAVLTEQVGRASTVGCAVGGSNIA